MRFLPLVPGVPVSRFGRNREAGNPLPDWGSSAALADTSPVPRGAGPVEIVISLRLRQREVERARLSGGCRKRRLQRAGPRPEVPPAAAGTATVG